MGLSAIACAVIGHRWRIDETSTDSEAHIRCMRCGRRQLPAPGTAFEQRLGVETSRDRAVGPMNPRR
jgi:hypothetical protein